MRRPARARARASLGSGAGSPRSPQPCRSRERQRQPGRSPRPSLDYAGVDRAWLSRTIVDEHDYVPQLGDRVMYFPEGHEETLAKFVENTAPPWQQFPTLASPVVECEVVAVEFLFPTPDDFRQSPSVVCGLQMKVRHTTQGGGRPSPAPVARPYVSPRTIALP